MPRRNKAPDPVALLSVPLAMRGPARRFAAYDRCESPSPCPAPAPSPPGRQPAWPMAWQAIERPVRSQAARARVRRGAGALAANAPCAPRSRQQFPPRSSSTDRRSPALAAVVYRPLFDPRSKISPHADDSRQPDVYPQGSLRQSGAAGGAAGIKSLALGERPHASERIYRPHASRRKNRPTRVQIVRAWRASCFTCAVLRMFTCFGLVVVSAWLPAPPHRCRCRRWRGPRARPDGRRTGLHERGQRGEVPDRRAIGSGAHGLTRRGGRRDSVL